MVAKAAGARGKADALASVLTRYRCQCEYCGITLPFGEVDTSHYVGRGFTWTRTYRPNLVAACRSCHRKVESRPDLHWRWFVDLRGADVERECHERATNGVKSAIKFDWDKEVDRLAKLVVTEVLPWPDLSEAAEHRAREAVGKRRLERLSSLR